MEIETIKELIKSFSEAELTSLSLKCEDFELKLGKEQTVYQTVMAQPPMQTAPALQNVVQNNGVMVNEPEIGRAHV